MLARSDIVDIFLKAIDSLSSVSGEGLPVPDKSADAGLSSASGGEKASRRMFISDWELRRLHKPAEKSIHIPPSAIISPLSSDWLEYEGIEVIFDETGK